MDLPSGVVDIVPFALPDDAWVYWRPGIADIVELALVQGEDAGLPDHFHDEDQVTFVISGYRRFFIGTEWVVIGPGRGVCIPAGTSHRSLSEPDGVVCINLYLHASECDTRALLDRLAEAWCKEARLPIDTLARLVSDYRCPVPMNNVDPLPLMSGSTVSVTAAAREFAMSREGYSRAFRRVHGMPPQRFGIIARLNGARKLLRAGASPADAAAAAGFADQSHLGRWFRRAFGVTPSRYRGRFVSVTSVPDKPGRPA